MLYLDYTWDLSPRGIVFDNELNIDKLGWRHGDCFKVINVNGRAMLVKMEAVEQFSKGHKVNEQVD
jgi:anaerobic selenocysteine-containing dehydrogenase